MNVSFSRRASAGSPWIKFGLTAVTACLAGLALLCSSLAIGYQERIIAASRYNGTFDFAQTSVQLLRLQLAIEQSASSGDLDEVALRYAILTNQLNILSGNPSLMMLDQSSVVESLRKLLRDLAPRIEALPAPEAANSALSELRANVGPVLGLTSLSHVRAGDEILQNQHQLKTIFTGLCIIVLMLVLFGAALIVFVFRQNRNLNRIARTDALTGLANRHSFHFELGDIRNNEMAVVLVDVDHFKALNDVHGHAAGDGVLRELAVRLRSLAFDAHLIARTGGDEFGLLFTGPDAGARSRTVCKRILSGMDEPFALNEGCITTSVTLGAHALRVEGAVEATSLLADVDIALHAAKSGGRGSFMPFHADMKREFLHRQRLQEDLRAVATRNELFLAFQPIVALADGTPRGFEALLRWRHPELGVIAPSDFIPVAEESGEILPIGRWVIEEACRHAASWPAGFVAVNVSARQLADDMLPFHVMNCVRSYGLSPNRLVIEITESALIENDASALAILEALQAFGCRISLDDFGTGYASLSYLRRFPFDKLKIDRSFLRDTADDSDGETIISTICVMAKQLSLEIVAEGIETEAHRRIVTSAGADFGQGYLFDRPLAPEDVLARFQGATIRHSLPAPTQAAGSLSQFA